MKILLLNGPPKSGKNAAARMLRNLYGVQEGSLARALKEMVHSAYGLGDKTPHDVFEEIKDKPTKIFMGASPRETYIRFSEHHMKPLHGRDIFGRIFVDRLQAKLDLGAIPEFLAVTDAGFEEECHVIIDKFGADNVCLIRLHRDGCSFENDSRSYIDLPDIESFDLHADDLDVLYASISAWGETHLAEASMGVGRGQWL